MTVATMQRVRPRATAPREPAPGRARKAGKVRWGLVPAWVLMVIGALSMILPVVFIALTSLRTEQDYSRGPLTFPEHWTFGNFAQAWSEGNFNQYALNSLIVVGIATALVVAISALAAFPLVFIPFRGKRAVLTVVIALMILPASIMVVPTFKIVQQLQLDNSYPGLVLVYTALSTPFGIYILSNFYRVVPSELMEAAALDGASLFQAFRRVVVPMARPALRTLTVLTALSLWNELLYSLVIMQDPAKRTLTAGVSLINSNPQLGGEENVPVLAAALGLTSVLPFVLYLMFNSTLSRGMTAGALK